MLGVSPGSKMDLCYMVALVGLTGIVCGWGTPWTQ